MKTLGIYCQQQCIGILDEEFSLMYDSNWTHKEGAFAISHSLPLHCKQHDRIIVRNYFANLLPEGQVRALYAAQHRIPLDDDFGLLGAIGKECAGALSLVSSKDCASFAQFDFCSPAHYKILDSLALHKLIDDLPVNSIAPRTAGVSISVAGAQHKIALLRQDDSLALPLHGAPSNCILKIPIRGFNFSVENEYICLTLAKVVGLQVPTVEYLKVTDTPVIIISRFDRVMQGSSIMKLHQEDFCQALGISHQLKYESVGGPGIAQCAELLMQASSRPLNDLSSFTDWVLFNTLIGNMDAHAKNISLLHTHLGVRLAPHYDLLNTLFYGRQLNRDLAMRVGGQNKPRYILTSHWQQFSQDIGLPLPLIRQRLAHLAHAILQHLPTLPIHALPQQGALAICTSIQKQTHAVLKSLNTNN